METLEQLNNWIAEQERLNNEMKERLDKLEQEEQREDVETDEDNFNESSENISENNPDSEQELNEIERLFDN